MGKVVVLLATGFEEVEAFTVVDYLRRAEIEVNMVSIQESLQVEGSHGIIVLADMGLEQIQDIEEYDAVILPGGMPGTVNLRENNRVIAMVQEMYKREKLVAAICAAPTVLAKAEILKGREVTSYPGLEEYFKDAIYQDSKVVVDDNIITSQSASTAVDFALELIALLQDIETSNKVAKAILYTI